MEKRNKRGRVFWYSFYLIVQSYDSCRWWCLVYNAGLSLYKCILNHQSVMSPLWLDVRADGTKTYMESDWFSLLFFLGSVNCCNWAMGHQTQSHWAVMDLVCCFVIWIYIIDRLVLDGHALVAMAVHSFCSHATKHAEGLHHHIDICSRPLTHGWWGCFTSHWHTEGACLCMLLIA